MPHNRDRCGIHLVLISTWLWIAVSGVAAPLKFVQRGAWMGYPRGHAVSVAIGGNFAFTSTQDAGMAAYDISEPAHPRPIGGFSDDISYAADVRVSSRYAYVAGGGSGLHILSITNPAVPIRLGTYLPPFPGPQFSARGVFVAEPLIFLAADLAGLLIINVSNPSAPTLVGSYDTTGRANAVWVSNGYAYVADDSAGLRILNVVNPAAPSLISTCDTPGTAYGVEVSGGYAYVADAFSGVQVIDVRNIKIPTIAATYSTGSFVQKLRIEGNTLAIASDALRLLDISTPTNLIPLASSPVIAQAQGLDVSGPLACVVDYSGGLYAIDISSRTNAPIIGMHKNPIGIAKRIKVSGNRAYIADEANGLRILDVSSPAAPHELGNLDGYVEAVDVTNNIAYISGSGLHIYDLTDPARPLRLGGRTNLYAYDVQVDGNHVVVTDYHSGLAVYNAQNPASLFREDDDDPAWEGYRIHLSGSFAYVTGTYGQLGIFDLSFVDEPRLLSTYNQGGRGGSAAARGPFVFFANSADGLEVLNASQITNVSRVAGYSISNAIPGGIRLHGKHAYVAYGSAGLRVLDISDPEHPSLAGSFDTGGFAADVEVAGRYVYVADSAWGVAILEQVSNATLTASASPNGMLLSWPQIQPAAALEQADEPTGPWTAVPTAGQNSYIAPLESAQRFYRLIEPTE